MIIRREKQSITSAFPPPPPPLQFSFALAASCGLLYFTWCFLSSWILRNFKVIQFSSSEGIFSLNTFIFSDLLDSLKLEMSTISQ